MKSFLLSYFTFNFFSSIFFLPFFFFSSSFYHRLIDRQKVLECQLEENKRKNEEDRKIQIKNQEAEMKNVTEDFSALSLANNSKIEFITKEWNLAVVSSLNL